MSLSVIIAENDLIEATRLSTRLERAGYTVAGIGVSYQQIITLLKKNKTDVVLLEISADGDLSSIALASFLANQNIPFILMASDYKADILEFGKQTNSYGFLIKPFRDQDLLASLEIAAYRNKASKELSERQERWLETLLLSIMDSSDDKDQKLFLIVKAFTSFLPFDFLVIDTDLTDRSPAALYSYQRTGFDEYISIGGVECIRICKLNADEFYTVRRSNGQTSAIHYLNGKEFLEESRKTLHGEKVRKTYNFYSRLWVPLFINGKVGMGMTFYSLESQTYGKSHVDLLRTLQNVLKSVLLNIQGETNNGRPGNEQSIYKKAPTELINPQVEGIIGKSPRLIDALDKAIHVARFDSSVLVLGETGVGKEGLVRAIHSHSQREGKPFIRINCAAIAPSLVESELFGHEKGAFTGAMDKRIGKFEQAHGGTLFLDEIGELSLEIQGKLLRALQEKEIERVGGSEIIKTDVRVIAATNRNLLADVSAGKFRMDLYYRINVFPITLPALRERKEDIPYLAEYFLKKFNPQPNISYRISARAMRQLQLHTWPGNIRELQHLIERHILMASSPIIDQFEMPEEIPAQLKAENATSFKPIVEIDKAHIIAALNKSNGKISGKGGAAELLKIPSTTLNSKIKRLGIIWPGDILSGLA